MAYPTLVNSQVTDAVTQQTVGTLGNAAAMAMATVYQSSAHSIGIAFQNAVQAQKNSSISAQAATNMGVIQLYSGGSMATAAATSKMAKSNGVNDALLLLIAMKMLKS